MSVNMEVESKVFRDNNSQIPVVDLSYLDSGKLDWDQLDKVKIDQLAQHFGIALQNSGLIFIKNHGISQKLIDKAFEDSFKFFQLDSSEKEKYSKLDYTNSVHEGYGKLGMDSLSNVSEPREFYNFHKKFQIIEDKPQRNDDIGKPDNDLVLQLESTFITLEQQCSQLFIKLLRLLSLSIGMEDIDFFANKAKCLVDKSVNSYNVVRTLYYPSLSSLLLGQEKGNSTIVGNGMRFSEHTDWGIFTIVFRDGVDGLEVRTNDGNWTRAEPEPENIALFVGDLLELWTGKYYKAAVHRVKELTDENDKNKSRQSIAYFLNLDAEVIVEPLKDVICFENCETKGAIQFEPFSIHKFVENKSTAAYGQK